MAHIRYESMFKNSCYCGHSVASRGVVILRKMIFTVALLRLKSFFLASSPQNATEVLVTQ